MAPGETRERIVTAAIRLFNERGTAAVSTNHIAEDLGISPGNLYYHFRNKESIILAAYERAVRAYDQVWQRAGATPASPQAILRLLEETFVQQWEYRFFQRELPALVRRDERLAAMYREVQARRLVYYRDLIETWTASGLVKAATSSEIDDLVTATWVIGDSWVGWLDAMGREQGPAEVRQGARLIYLVIRPYLDPETVRRIDLG